MEIIPSFQNLLKTGFRFTGKNLANLFSRIEFFKPKLAPEKHLIIGTYGNPKIGKMLLEKNFIFGNVKLDVETDTPWAIKPFSQEVERAINGLEWLNDLSAINGQDAREIAALWINKLPYKKIRNDIMSATHRLRSTSKNFLFLKTALNNEIEKKLYNIIKTDFLFIKTLKPFVFDLFETRYNPKRTRKAAIVLGKSNLSLLVNSSDNSPDKLEAVNESPAAKVTASAVVKTPVAPTKLETVVQVLSELIGSRASISNPLSAYFI